MIAGTPPTRRKLVVLSVEDDVLVAMGTGGTLEDLGHEVIEASSGAQALAILAERSDIGLVITDHGMPGMSGVALAQAIRARWPRLPIVLVTGYLESPPDFGLQLPCLQKPFRAAELAEAISQAMAKFGHGASGATAPLPPMC
jgi:CheY-like chemotaxis protein